MCLLGGDGRHRDVDRDRVSLGLRPRGRDRLVRGLEPPPRYFRGVLREGRELTPPTGPEKQQTLTLVLAPETGAQGNAESAAHVSRPRPAASRTAKTSSSRAG